MFRIGDEASLTFLLYLTAVHDGTEQEEEAVIRMQTVSEQMHWLHSSQCAAPRKQLQELLQQLANFHGVFELGAVGLNGFSSWIRRTCWSETVPKFWHQAW